MDSGGLEVLGFRVQGFWTVEALRAMPTSCNICNSCFRQLQLLCVSIYIYIYIYKHIDRYIDR